MLCAAIHFMADFSFTQSAWLPDGDSVFSVMAIPISQCSLIAIWAATSRRPLIVRSVVPVFMGIALWFLVAHVVTWNLGSPMARSWAIAFATHIIVAASVITMYRRWLARQRNEAAPFSFDLNFLFVSTTTAALVLCFFQYGRINWGWSEETTEWDEWLSVPMLGVLSGLVASLWLWPFEIRGFRRRFYRLAVSAGAFIVLMVLAFGIQAGRARDTEEATAVVVQQSVHSLCLVASLGMISRWRE